MNDIIIGTAVTAFLYENRAFLASNLFRIYMVGVESITTRPFILIRPSVGNHRCQLEQHFSVARQLACWIEAEYGT